ncbi:MAG: hypothetical protein AAF915_07455 [Cyanobacteria bacterium P01_D01_bin.50]
MSEKKVGLGKQQVELVGLFSESLHIYLTVFAEIYKFIYKQITVAPTHHI